MDVNLEVFLIILGMGLVTYATRSGGLWMMGRIKLSPRVEAGLRYVPGAVFISMIAPALFTGGLAELAAGILTGAIAVRTRNLLLAMIIGVLAVWLFRQVK
ncbi:AzlD domain-containing protein [Candidatus Chlorohelix sp.]|uniref:AzlD family protein n=1 Tax=Candidatus Chlorohelix sp. TaxID=3139201 RepID=UPI003036447C